MLGVAVNMDQFLNMQAIEAFGAGLLVRGDRVSPALIHAQSPACLARTASHNVHACCSETHRERKGESPLGDHLVRLATKNRRHRAPPPS